jgi:LysM repeat protein
MLLRTPAFQEEMAGAIAKAIVKFVPSGQPHVPGQVAGASDKHGSAAAKKEDGAEKPLQREGRAIEKAREDEAAPAPKKAAAKAQQAEERKSSAAEPARTKKNGTVTYRVKKGDTLEKIADRNGTTVAELLHLNHMKLKEPLWVDRKLKVPAPTVREEEKAAPEVITYNVKKGDTLEKIALKHHTTVRSIRTLNHLKTNDPMYVGRKLKVGVEKPDEDLPAEPAGSAKKQKPDVKKASAAEPVQKLSTYRVKKGDTLEKIAARHDTTVAELMRLNSIKLKDPLWVDRKLKLTAAEKEKGREAPAEKKTAVKPQKKTATYVVRKGDTLEKIASKHNTSIAALIKVNKIKLTEPLYVNRKLIIPAEEDI